MGEKLIWAVCGEYGGMIEVDLVVLWCQNTGE